jgi:hypothetical protein
MERLPQQLLLAQTQLNPTTDPELNTPTERECPFWKLVAKSATHATLICCEDKSNTFKEPV